MKKILISFLILWLDATFVTELYAQSAWSQLGSTPNGAPVIDLAVDNSNRVYVLTYPNSEVYYTSNNGISWNKIPGIYNIMNVDDIEVDKNSGRLFLSCYLDGIYWTSNLGASWSNEDFYTNPISGWHASIYKTVQKPNTNIVVSAESGVYLTNSTFWKTNNLGSAVWSNASFSFGVRDLKYIANGNLLAGAHDGIYTSSNDGSTWTSLSPSISGFEITSIAEKTASGKLFAGAKFNTLANDTSGCGIFVSSDGGLTWVNSSSGMTDRRISSVSVDANGNLYATAYGSVYQSSNDGVTWTAINAGLNSSQDYLTIMSNNSGVFVGSRKSGVAFSAAPLTGWNYRNSGLHLSSINSFCIGQNGEVFILDGSAAGVHKWNSNNWSPSNAGQPASVGGNIVRDANGIMYASFLDKSKVIYKSVDNGVSWQAITTLPLQTNIFWAQAHLQLDPLNNLYAIVYYSPTSTPSSVFRSTDGGLTWTNVYTVNFSTTNNLSAIALASDSTIYFTTEDINGNWVIEYSKGWSNVLHPLQININTQTFNPYYRLSIDANDSLYITESTEIYKRNGINNWVQLPNGGWGNNVSMIGNINLRIDKQNNLYSTCISCGVYKSTDGGNTWSNISTGIPLFTPPFNTPILNIFSDIQFDANNVPYALSFNQGANGLMGVYVYTNTVTTGINDHSLSDSELLIYPNPTQEDVTLVFKEELQDNLSVEVYNALGKQMIGEREIVIKKANNAVELNTDSYPAGVYFVKVTNGQTIFTSKFVKR